LQERNEAQPQIEQQPLQPADTSVSATEWVANLHNKLPSIPRPEVPDFEVLYGDSFIDDSRLSSEGLSGASRSISAQATDMSIQSVVESLSLDELEPSVDFQEDAAFLQSTSFELDPPLEEDTWVPPPLPVEPVCDG
jgi:hypothetical protein